MAYGDEVKACLDGAGIYIDASKVPNADTFEDVIKYAIDHLNELDADVLAALDEAGHPVIRIGLADPLDIGAEFFRWEMATATAAGAAKRSATARDGSSASSPRVRMPSRSSTSGSA